MSGISVNPPRCNEWNRFNGRTKRVHIILYYIPEHFVISFAYPCDVIHSKQSGDDVIICGPGEQLYCHGSELLHARLRPVLQTRLREGKIKMIKQVDQDRCCATPTSGHVRTRNISTINLI